MECIASYFVVEHIVILREENSCTSLGDVLVSLREIFRS